MFDFFDVVGEDDEEFSFGEAGVVYFFAEADAGNVEGFFVAGFDGVGFAAGLVVAHVFDGFESDAFGVDCVVEAVHAYAALFEWGVTDNPLFVDPLGFFLFLLFGPPLVYGGFFYWCPERVSALLDCGSGSGDEEFADCHSGFFFVEADFCFCLYVFEPGFESVESGDVDGDVIGHGCRVCRSVAGFVPLPGCR